MTENHEKRKDKSAKFVRMHNIATLKQISRTGVVEPIDLSSSWNKNYATIAVLVTFFCLQVAVSVNRYSGESQPPMFGDYEAQRHWMEVTNNLAVKQWYTNGTDNNLLYWGLDYPPLTAFHHYFLGLVASKVNEDWVALSTSRGFESIGHKLFMRVSAIVPFYIFYLPSLLFYFSTSKKTTPMTVTLALLYPGLLVIDNGHFQYNSVSLGFFLAAYIFLVKNHMITGSIFFVAALNYKQMELYHALPVFVFILSRSIKKTAVFESFLKVLKIGVVVISSFVIIWLPFLTTGAGKAVLERIFPFNRGLYEDKVASFWCAFSFILKRMPINGAQILTSVTMVLLSSLPSLIQLFLRPTDKKFRLSLVSTSLSFFLFSYHVHEKTILLAATPALLLLPDYPGEVAWFLGITNISLFSLCVKDQFSTSLFLFASYSIIALAASRSFQTSFKCFVQLFSIFSGISLCILELYGPKISTLPHIYQLANALFCCIHFLYFLVFFTSKMTENEKNDFK